VTLARQEQDGARRRLENGGERLRRAFHTMLEQRQARLGQFGQLLQSLSHAAVLARGFALVRDEADKLVRSAEAARTENLLVVEFADGRVVTSPVAEGAPKEATPSRKPRAKQNKVDQGSLF
jgi:exodeoxyribonuclease VII large subunit